jgi:N-acetylglutamate synthase-like GNAT family acetyltransferase
LSLTAKGSQLKPQFRDIWNDIAAALHEIISESGVDVMSLLCKLEQSHARESLSERVAKLQKVRNQNRVEILEFSPELAEHFASINYQWISHYFQIEEEDRLVLDNPVEKIIEPGGAIIFAQLDGEIVGTVALKPENPDLYELTKMGVLPQVRGRQVGLKLGQAILEKAREMKIPKVFLDSNKKLKPALNLYRKLGFEEVGVEDESAYVRCDIRMEWKP